MVVFLKRVYKALFKCVCPNEYVVHDTKSFKKSIKGKYFKKSLFYKTAP